ncbi:MAG TPA: replication protein [Armatimonadota bacterium]|nr:replication protein [Armatimonadota bacterium]
MPRQRKSRSQKPKSAQSRGAPATDPFEGFGGYESPHWTPLPDSFYDEHLRYLSGSEVKILVTIFRLTVGWKKAQEKISAPRLADRTGLAESTVRETTKKLEAKGLIDIQRRTTAAGDADAHTYSIRWSENQRTPQRGSTDNQRTVRESPEDRPPMTGGQEQRQPSKKQTLKRKELRDDSEQPLTEAHELGLQLHRNEITREEFNKRLNEIRKNRAADEDE